RTCSPLNVNRPARVAFAAVPLGDHGVVAVPYQARAAAPLGPPLLPALHLLSRLLTTRAILRAVLLLARLPENPHAAILRTLAGLCAEYIAEHEVVALVVDGDPGGSRCGNARHSEHSARAHQRQRG